MKRKLKIQIGGSLVLTAFSAVFMDQTASAQSCIKTPTCAELGYAQSASDCTGKTILKCPLDTSKVYCPSDMESSKIYKIGDAFVDKNGIALGKVVEVDKTGAHGTVAVSGGIGTAVEASQYCASRTYGGLNWGLATGSHACVFRGETDAGGSKCIESYGSGCVLHSSSGFGCCSPFFRLGNDGGIYPVPSCKLISQLGYFCEALF